MTDEQKWTPEPWYVIPNPEWPGARSRVARSPDEPWANFAEICYPGNANARRIVRCVNALAGIENPGAVRELVEAARAAVSDLDGPKWERLQAALEALDQKDSSE